MPFKPYKMTDLIAGFSKLNKEEKIAWLSRTYLKDNAQAAAILKQYWNQEPKLQQLHEEFAENTVSNYYLPFGIAPNFIINGIRYAIPMVIEESSVIAAASKAAKFWAERGGFRAEVLGTKKIGQVHFMYSGTPEKLMAFFEYTLGESQAEVSAIIGFRRPKSAIFCSSTGPMVDFF